MFGLLLLSNLGFVQAEQSGPDIRTRLDDLVSSYQQHGYLNGVVLVAEHGKLLYAKGVGEADMQAHIANTTQTRFVIASLTKQFTAVLVLQEVAKGKLRLEAPISEYLPWYRQDTGRQITIEQLLHHTSGLPPDYDSPAFCDSAAARQPCEPLAFAQRFCQPGLIARPGTKWAYSNGGYVLLGLVLEQVTGKSFSDLLHEQILAPLGMKNTGILSHGIREFNGAIGYTRHAGARYTQGPNQDLGHVFSAGAMYSTAEDLLLWTQALGSGVLLPPTLQAQVFKPGLNNWAYGWFVNTIAPGAPGAGSAVAEMRGDCTGNFFSWILLYPGQERTVIVLRNGYGSTEHFEDNVQAILFGGQAHMPRRSPKDVLAHVSLVGYGWLTYHRSLLLLIFVLALGTGWRLWKRNATANSPIVSTSIP